MSGLAGRLRLVLSKEDRMVRAFLQGLKDELGPRWVWGLVKAAALVVLAAVILLR